MWYSMRYARRKLCQITRPVVFRKESAEVRLELQADKLRLRLPRLSFSPQGFENFHLQLSHRMAGEQQVMNLQPHGIKFLF